MDNAKFDKSFAVYAKDPLAAAYVLTLARCSPVSASEPPAGGVSNPACPVPPGGAQLGGPARGIAQVSGDVVAEIDLRWM